MFNRIKNNVLIKKECKIGLFEIEGMKVRGAFYKNDRLLITKLLTTYIPTDVEVKIIKSDFFIDNSIFKGMIVNYAKNKDTSLLLPLCKYEEAVDDGFKIESNLYL